MHHSSLLAILRAFLLVAAQFILSVRAEEAAPLSARDLAARLSANVQDGSSSVRVRMEIRAPAGASKTVLQLQIKSRRTQTTTDVVCQVFWPKERKGESFLLRRTEDREPSGTYFKPPDSLRPITSSQMKDAVFGGDLSYADLLENFFAWEQQSMVGTEIVDRVSCQILESRPGKGDRSIYGRVLSWIDLKRLVPLRVEKYFESGQQARRIDTTRVAEDDKDRRLAASLVVRSAGQDSVTELEGSKIRHDVSLSDNDFTTEALRAQPAKVSNPK
jgi:Outer membrane lipoprotein-sorting protein